MALLSRDALEALGFAALGEDVRISERASIYGAARIRLGSHVRIDDFCVLSAGAGGIEIGNYVHIAVYSLLIGAARISMADFSGLSARVSIYSSSDDYSGAFMTNPMVPAEFTGVNHASVTLGRHVIVGSGSVVLPGVTFHEGSAVGALSLVYKDCEAFGIYAGNPARRIKERKRDVLDKEAAFLRSISRPIA
jgi:galactoside O-acetyltransferase